MWFELVIKVCERHGILGYLVARSNLDEKNECVDYYNVFVYSVIDELEFTGATDHIH